MDISIEHDTIELEYIKISRYMKRERAVETEVVYRTICLLRTLIETVNSDTILATILLNY